MRGDGPIEQKDGDAPANGIVEGVDHGGFVTGLDDQARGSPADGGTDCGGVGLGRGSRFSIGLGEPEGNHDLPELATEDGVEENAVVVRWPGQDQFHDPRTPALVLPRGRDG